MGLDMYLSKKIYTYNKIIKVEIDSKEIKYNIHDIKIDLIYWKNFYSIHDWFVENVQGGDDNGEKHYVSEEQLFELMNCCREDIKYLESLDFDIIYENPELKLEKLYYKVFNNVDKKNLKLHLSIWLNEAIYDEYYLDELKDTVNQLENILEVDKIEGDFYYLGCW